MAMKTPGVYIVEKNAFPNSVVQVATAVPAFIGYTESAELGNNSLDMKPFRISTMSEFETHFGGPPHLQFELKKKQENDTEDLVLPLAEFKVKKSGGDMEGWRLEQAGEDYCLYASMLLFFQNGGGACYIVSVGQYGGKPTVDQEIDYTKMMDGIKTLIKEPEPTMVVIPETTRLKKEESISVQQAMLKHCGYKMRNRFALLDIHQGHLELQDKSTATPVKSFRNDLGINQLDFGAAYYPWVKTTAMSSRQFTFENIVNRDVFKELLINDIQQDNKKLAEEQEEEVSLLTSRKLLPPPIEEGDTTDSTDAAVSTDTTDSTDSTDTTDTTETTVPVQVNFDPELATFEFTDGTVFSFVEVTGTKSEREGRSITVADDGKAVVKIAGRKTGTWSPAGTLEADTENRIIKFTPAPSFSGSIPISYTVKKGADDQPKEFTTEVTVDGPTVAHLDKTLRAICPLYNEVMETIAVRSSILSPGALMAGIYTMVDNTRGVWKAPANVSLNSVIQPMVNVSHDDQEDLNVSATGKSINAIRPFVGEGTLVWGARTLDGNSLDWRYINVRRTMIMIEESIRLASKAYVFEPNVANTWITMRSMMENFLNSIWKQGGLAGSTPDDAYSVHVGLGETMSPTDILEGILRVTVLVAISRPAEFIEVTFQQQMQKS